ncbi:MAG: matrixin family metalloprotease [Wenzhouxiangellaceae bacterium]
MQRTRLYLITALVVTSQAALAGGHLDTFKFTGQELAPGIEAVDVVPIRWDERCSNLQYVINSAALPNQGSPLEVSIADLEQVIQQSFDAWNDIPTSFISFQVVDSRDTGNAVRSFDFINEITFSTAPGFTALASSPSVSLQQDINLVPGMDLNGDGDSDVFDPDAEGINQCADIDGDGNIEFPAGFYPAGTILENDVQFNTNVLWSTQPVAGAADIGAVATHEFGHSHGLAHDFINQISDDNRFGSTMFPFISTNDPEAEAATRQLHTDDIAWSSFIYPEASFDNVYSVVRGEISDIDGLGVLGANVYAVDQAGDRTAVTAHSGTLRVLGINGGLFVAQPEIGIVNGEYELPLPRGNYQMFLQSPDVAGATGGNISTTSAISASYGQVGYDEEGIGPRNQETAFERRPGQAQQLVIRPGSRPVKVIDAVINESIQLQDFVVQSFGGTGAALAPGTVYAQRFSNADMLSVLEAGAAITSATFQITAFDAVDAPRFERAALALGFVNGDGTVELVETLTEQSGFIGQDGDLSPFYFNASNGLGRRVENKLRKDPGLDVFVVLEAFDNPDLRPGGAIPPLLALEAAASGNSFLATNNGPLASIGFNWLIQLVLAP